MSLNPANTQISAGQHWPPVYVRGQANTASLELSGGAGALTASAATYTLKDPNGTEIVSDSATITAGRVSYSLTSTHLPSTQATGRGYLESWVVTVAGQDGHIEREVLVGLRDLPMPVPLGDLIQRYSTLNSNLPRGATTWTQHLTGAWGELLRRLATDGLLAYQALNPSALYDVLEHLTLKRIFADLALTHGADNAYRISRDEHSTAYEAAYNALRLKLDQLDAGTVPEKLTPARPAVIHTNAAPYFQGPRNSWRPW